jgi:pyridoxamine 5'-phosphate oxidase
MNDSTYYNDLGLSLDHAWTLIKAGAKDRRSAFHTPVVSTIGLNNAPQSRVLVLRTANKEARELKFNTDLRSPKVAEIEANPNMSVLLYDSETKIQLRLSGQAQIQSQGTEVNAVWLATDRFARRCYMAESAPSSVSGRPTSGLPESTEGRKPEEAELIPARANFALLLFEVQKIDWLYLAAKGHRRAVFHYDIAAQSWLGDWAVP